MRAMLWTVILAFAAWSGWWWFASSTAKTAAEDAFVAARAQGYAAGHGGIAVAGFPNRVDLTVTRPEFAAASGDWGWKAPFVQLFALTYKPWHVIAAFAPEQEIATPFGPLALKAGKLQSSLVLVPGVDLTLDRSQLAGEALSLSGGFGEIGVQSFSLATRQALAAANGHDIGLDLQEIALPPAVQELLPAAEFPPGQAALHVETEAVFDAPLDRHAAVSQPKLTQLTFRNSALSWGAARLGVTGSLKPDAEGRAEGQLMLEISGGAEILRAAQALGLISADLQRKLEMLTLAARNGQPLTLPLVFASGQVRLGPFPLAEAPRLR